MSTWLFFAILAPILWGFTVILDSIFRRDYIKSNLVLSWCIAFFRLPVAISIIIIIGYNSLPLGPVIWMLLSGMLWIIPIFLYIKALEFEESSRVALLFNFAPVFTLIIAYFFINEQLSIQQLIAFAVILTGGILAALKAHPHPQKKWQLSKAFWMIGLACIFWASGDVLFKAIEPLFSHYLLALAFFLLGNSVPALVTIAFKKGRQKIKKHTASLNLKIWSLLVFNQVLGISAIFAFTYALTLGKASLTSVIVGLEPLTVFIIGAIFHQFIRAIPKEDLSRQSLILKGASFSLMIAGLWYLQG